jgi:hypothetical protein
MSTTKTATHWTDRLIELGATCEAVPWAKGYDSLDAAWAACERGDWMLWLVNARWGLTNQEVGSEQIRSAKVEHRGCRAQVREGYSDQGDVWPR